MQGMRPKAQDSVVVFPVSREPVLVNTFHRRIHKCQLKLYHKKKKIFIYTRSRNAAALSEQLWFRWYSGLATNHTLLHKPKCLGQDTESQDAENGRPAWHLCCYRVSEIQHIERLKGDEICRIRSQMQSQEADSFKQKMHLILGG